MTNVDRAVTALQAGELVVVPTDTVYGVAAHPGVEGSIQRLFWVKGRPLDKAIPILAATIGDAKKMGRFSQNAERLAGHFWPGALTLVLPRADGFDLDLGGSDPGTVAIRIPNDAKALELLLRTGPLAVTSANRSGEPAATTVEAARGALGERVTVYVDDGEMKGSGSTVVSLVGKPKCIRQGDLPYEEVLAVLA